MNGDVEIALRRAVGFAIRDIKEIASPGVHVVEGHCDTFDGHVIVGMEVMVHPCGLWQRLSKFELVLSDAAWSRIACLLEEMRVREES